MERATNITYQLGWRLNTDEEHIVVTTTWKTYDGDSNPRWWGLVMPIKFEEQVSGDWQIRVKQRIESYENDCGCYIPIVFSVANFQIENLCEYHQWLHKQWEEDDFDAIDSWRESRGDVDAMMRRLERKIKAKDMGDEHVL